MIYSTRASRFALLFASLLLDLKITGASPLDVRDIAADSDLVTPEDFLEIAADGTGPLRSGKSTRSSCLTI